MSLKAHLKATYENSTMCARSHGPEEAYEYAARMCESARSTIDKELESLALELEQGKTEEVIKKLRTIMK